MILTYFQVSRVRSKKGWFWAGGLEVLIKEKSVLTSFNRPETYVLKFCHCLIININWYSRYKYFNEGFLSTTLRTFCGYSTQFGFVVEYWTVKGIIPHAGREGGESKHAGREGGESKHAGREGGESKHIGREGGWASFLKWVTHFGMFHDLPDFPPSRWILWIWLSSEETRSIPLDSRGCGLRARRDFMQETRRAITRHIWQQNRTIKAFRCYFILRKLCSTTRLRL